VKILLFITLIFSNLISFEGEKKLENYIYKKFTGYYPSMSVSSIMIKANSTIPKGYKLSRVFFQKNSLKRENGNFSAIYSKDSYEKRVFLKYHIDATVPVFVATDAITSHTPLDSSMFSIKTIKFTNFYDKPIQKLAGYESKTYLPKGKILTSRLVRKTPLIYRNSTVNAVASDGGLEVYFTAKALEDGSLGQVIKVKRDRKILRAKVISQDKVQIR